MFKKLLLISLILISSLAVFSQTRKLHKAEKYYNKLSYSKAIEVYTELIGTKLDNSSMKVKLAKSYYNIGDMKNAVNIYGNVFSSEANVEVDHIFYYAQALKQTGNYPESDKWMSKFHELTKSDQRGTSYATNTTYLEQIKKEGNHFEIRNATFNTEFTDFGGYTLNKTGKVYFLTSRRSKAVQHYWTWNGKTFLDIYSFNEVDSTNIRPKLFSKKINSKYHEGPICFTLDENRVYFTRNNISRGIAKHDSSGIQHIKLYTAEVNEDGKWFNQKELTINSRFYSVGHPTISTDGKLLYFVSDMPGGFGGSDIYKAEILTDGNLGTPINLGKTVNTEGKEMFPWISSDGLLFFASDGFIGLGGLDIFLAKIEKDGSIKNKLNAGEGINSQRDDFGLTFKKDLKTGYFSSNRDGGLGEDDIYTFRIIRPFQFNIELKGNVLDNLTKLIIKGAKVYLKNNKGIIVDSVDTDASGAYLFNIEYDQTYTIEAFNKDYFENSVVISTIGTKENSIQQNVELDKDYGIFLYGLIKDTKTNKEIEDVYVTIVDNKTGVKIFADKTSQLGDFNIGLANTKIKDILDYSIKLEKEGYLTKTANFKYIVKTAGIINVNELMNVSLNKVDVGIDLATIINIKPIYFDYGKYIIRKDAAIELDKIVKIMTENPKMEIELGSHTDCRGTIASNDFLSNNRATASAKYIKERIPNPERIYGKGFGESKLKVNCPCEGTVKSTCPEAEHQKNRRTEFIIMKM